MQSAEVVLSILSQKSAQNSEFVFDRLYRNLFNPDFYMLAYNNIYVGKGNMAEGIEVGTIDGFHAAQVEKLISLLKQETYSPRAVRRMSSSEKPETLRPLAAPSLLDRLVQEVIRLLLQAIYEPVFKDSSHGSRPNRSCHTALVRIKTTCKGTHWVIEGDIKKFFDTIHHGSLHRLLARRICDGRFLNLIDKFLKAGYLEHRQAHHSLAGTLQGEIIGPMLANIYLHELDVLMEALCEDYSTRENMKRSYLPSQRLDSQFLASTRDERGSAEALLAETRTGPSHDVVDSPSVRIQYTRYADDFVVMIIGSKSLAVQIREIIKNFLQQELQLELDMEKTVITDLLEQRASFLGYEIARSREHSQGSKKAVVKKTIQLLVPGEVIRKQLEPFVAHERATHHSARINLPLLDLLKHYNAEIRELYHYYCLATDVSTKIGKFKYYHYYSLLKTVARKERCSIAQVLNKYGVDVKLKQGTGTKKIFGIAYQGPQGSEILTYFNDPIEKLDHVLKDDKALCHAAIHAGQNYAIKQAVQGGQTTQE